MRGLTLLVAALIPALPVSAETLVAARTIRAQAILAPSDIALADATIPGALTDPADAVGLEARVVLYAGRPIRPVAKWQLMIALTLSVPAVDWFTPWL